MENCDMERERSFNIVLYDVNNFKWRRNKKMRKKISLYKALSRRFLIQLEKPRDFSLFQLKDKKNNPNISV